MNQLVKQNYVGQDLAIAERTGGMSIAPRNVADIIEFGHLMSTSGHAVPKHLRGNPGACMAVAMQAFEWEMSPFAVARKTYLVNDNIAYEAQLIAAVINTRAGLKQRLAIEWHGEGAELFCTVKGEFRDGSKHTYTSPPVGSITTKNSPLWKSDPRQQIAYFSVRSWGRLYAPEVILGIYDRDEAEQIGPNRAKDITPIIDPFSDAPPVEQEVLHDALAVDSMDINADAETLTGEADSNQTEDNSQSSDNSSPSDDGSDGTASSPDCDTVAANPSDAGNGVDEGAGDTGAADGQSASSAPDLSDEDRAWLLSVAKQLWAATGVGEQDLVSGVAGDLRNSAPETISGGARAKAVSIVKQCKLVCYGEQDAADTLELIAGIVGVETKDIV